MEHLFVVIEFHVDFERKEASFAKERTCMKKITCLKDQRRWLGVSFFRGGVLYPKHMFSFNLLLRIPCFLFSLMLYTSSLLTLPWLLTCMLWKCSFKMMARIMKGYIYGSCYWKSWYKLKRWISLWIQEYFVVVWCFVDWKFANSGIQSEMKIKNHDFTCVDGELEILLQNLTVWDHFWKNLAERAYVFIFFSHSTTCPLSNACLITA